MAAIADAPVSTTTIRLAESEDLSAILRLGEQFRAASPYRDVLVQNDEHAQIILRKLIRGEGGAMWVADRAGEVVGMIGMILFPHYFSGELMASELLFYVDPMSRGMGLKLLRAAEAWAVACGARSISMIAPTEDIGRIYARFHYQPSERAYVKRLT